MDKTAENPCPIKDFRPFRHFIQNNEWFLYNKKCRIQNAKCKIIGEASLPNILFMLLCGTGKPVPYGFNGLSMFANKKKTVRYRLAYTLQ